MEINFTPVGTVYSPFKTLEEMPIQPVGAEGIKGTVSIKPRYLDGLADLDGFSHIYLIYHFHQAGAAKLQVTPFLDDQPRGIFATRAPRRPNAIGLSVVKLNDIIGNLLQIENVDILNGTPLLDIKPYVPEFDRFEADRIGWLSKVIGLTKNKRSDSRFR